MEIFMSTTPFSNEVEKEEEIEGEGVNIYAMNFRSHILNILVGNVPFLLRICTYHLLTRSS